MSTIRQNVQLSPPTPTTLMFVTTNGADEGFLILEMNWNAGKHGLRALKTTPDFVDELNIEIIYI